MVNNAELPKRLGRYEIVRELGKGAMGIVYEGRDPKIGRRVAIKTARKDISLDANSAREMTERFLREARAAGVLNHPNIVTVYDADEEGDIAYIAMEFIEGTELRRLLQEKHRFSPEETVHIIGMLCSALDHAHANGIVHRDVKPANVMVLVDGSVKITDFGIARITGSDLTRDGSLIGTPYYMSPEQFMGHKVDGRADLFSLGVIAYELLTGEKPFLGDSIGAVMHNVLKTEPIPPRELNFAVPHALDKVVLKALRKDPNQRYQTGKSMAAAFCDALCETPDPKILGLADGPEHDLTDETTTRLTEATLSQETKTLATSNHKAFKKPNSSGLKTISSAHHRIEKNRIKVVYLLVGVLTLAVGIGVFFGVLRNPSIRAAEPSWRAVRFEVFQHQFDTTGREQIQKVSSPTTVELYGVVNGEEVLLTKTILEDAQALVSFPEGKWPSRFRYVARNENFRKSAEGESVGEPQKPGDTYARMPIHFYVDE